MSTGILLGVILTLWVEFLIWLAVKSWRKTLPPDPPQPPLTPAQIANREVSEELRRYHPQLQSLRLQRRIRRGRKRNYMEEEISTFEP